MKAYLIQFLFRRELEVVFAWIVKNSVFLVQISDTETVIWWLTSLTDYYKRVHLLFKKLLLVVNQLQDSTFFIWY